MPDTGNYDWKLRVILEAGLTGNNQLLPVSEVVFVRRS
jgi:hypothetical protein